MNVRRVLPCCFVSLLTLSFSARLYVSLLTTYVLIAAINETDMMTLPINRTELSFFNLFTSIIVVEDHGTFSRGTYILGTRWTVEVTTQVRSDIFPQLEVKI